MIKDFIFGIHPIQTLLKTNYNVIKEIIIYENKKDNRIKNIINHANKYNILINFSNEKDLFNITKTTKHQGIVAIIDKKLLPQHTIEDILNNKEEFLLLILDGITDPHNLGACIRVADAMGVDAIIIPKDNSARINATVSKTSCGAAEVIPIITVNNLVRTIELLKKHNIWILGTDINATEDILNIDVPKSVAWVMGSEEKGLRRLTKESCDILVKIPMYGTVESLNVSVSTGIILMETKRQLKGKEN